MQRRGINLALSRLHESSPSLATHCYFESKCAEYQGSYWSQVAGASKTGAYVTCDLHKQPFADGRWDVVVTQDVLEHVNDPIQVLREISRTLASGGAHVFTVPRTAEGNSAPRVRWGKKGEPLAPPVYHGNPFGREGSLVVTDWGTDMESVLLGYDIECETVSVTDDGYGVANQVEVFFCWKS